MSHCYHCGLICEPEIIHFDSKEFCCLGCKSVFEILTLNNLTSFYELNKNAGIRPEILSSHTFKYLDTLSIYNALIDYYDDDTTLITFKIPVIHCSSCVWLLENLHNFNKKIIHSQVQFSQKTVQITYKNTEFKLSELAKFLTNLGYKPLISLENENKKPEKIDSSLLIKLAIAGFAFGNIMLFSLPEYFQDIDFWLIKYKPLFRWLIFLFTLPVVFYSASDYFKSAWISTKNKIINIDVPITIGIIVLFLRSSYEAYFDISTGYFDSLCGLIFFMLIGKVFQQRTYKSLAFDRDYKSFYPIAVTKYIEGKEENILLSELKKGDRIVIRNLEMIPADCILIKGEASIDNSFITGESQLVFKNIGDKIFAGGRQNGTQIQLEIIKDVNQSFLTQLWSKQSHKNKNSQINSLINLVSKYFTVIILLIALFGAIYWYFIDISKMFQVITAVLIVACPCALALSSPFTFGSMMRIFSSNNFYVKDTFTIEKMAKINSIVFDKTGTLTLGNEAEITFEGNNLTEIEQTYLYTLFKNSTHPLSRMLTHYLKTNDTSLIINNFKEITGKGLQGEINGIKIKVGSNSFIGILDNETLHSKVFVQINEALKGKFIIKNHYKKGLSSLFKKLKDFNLYLISGDNEAEKASIISKFSTLKHLHFNQSPEDKLNFIQALQHQNKKVMMIGDGLNDATALKQSDVGIAVAEDIHNFTPSSDVIIKGSQVADLWKYIYLAKKSVLIVILCFIISFLYNVIGLSFALSGQLSPLVAAILMPISSITVVSFTAVATWWVSRKYF